MATVAAGSTQLYSATATDSFGNSWDATADISASNGWSISSGAGGSWIGATYTSEKAGAWTVTGTYQGKSATASLTVTHAADQSHLSHITVSLDPITVAAPNTVTGTATAFDTFGNSWDISAQATWSIPAGNAGGSWSGNIYTSNTAGTYTVQALYAGKTATATLNVTGHLPTIIAITVSPKTASIAAGTPQTFGATASDGYNTWDVTSQVIWSIDSAAGGSWNQNTGTYISANAGIWTVTATLNTLIDKATLTVNANSALLTYIVINPKIATIESGASQKFTTTAYDQFGNSIGDVTSSTSFTAPGASVTANSISSNAVGSYSVTATYSGLTDTASLTVTGYSVTFTEKGLQAGTSWNITFGGQNYSSTTGTITVNGLSAQSYAWSTSSNSQNGQTRYLAAQTSGTL